MLIGGPFSFLAGLGLLGAAGVMKAAENAQVRERYREYNSHKHLPLGFATEMIQSAAIMSRYTFGGYDCSKIEKYLMNRYESVTYVNVREVRAVGMTRYFVEKMGYTLADSDVEYIYKKGMYYSNEYMNMDEFKLPHFDEAMNCQTEEELEALYPGIPSKGRDLWSAISGPYRRFAHYKKMGFFQDVIIPEYMLWRPDKGPRKEKYEQTETSED